MPVDWYFRSTILWYFIFSPELMHAVRVLHLSSLSSLIPYHQNMLLSASIFVEPGRPNCNASTTCFFNFPGITVFSPAINKQNRLVCLRKTEEKSSGACSFWLILRHILSCSIFGSTKFCGLEISNQSWNWHQLPWGFPLLRQWWILVFH